jgi:chromosomal replication initiation ATPase DnaA
MARRELYAALRAKGWSYPAIGRFVGNRDHTTVMAALREKRRGA